MENKYKKLLEKNIAKEDSGFKGSVTPAAILKVLPGIENPTLFIKAFIKIRKGKELMRAEKETLSDAFIAVLKLGPKETQKLLLLFKKIKSDNS